MREPRRSDALPAEAAGIRFVVLVAMRDMAPWVGDTIASIREQTHAEFRCFIGDDGSSDGSREIVRSAVAGDPRFTLVEHETRLYSLGNLHALIRHAAPAPSEVIVMVDGDDRLAHRDVLGRVADVYRRTGCWMTYGSFSGDGATRDAVCRPYPDWALKHNLTRRCTWRASHLKTFRHALWRRLPEDALRITPDEVRRARRRALLRGRLRAWRRWRDIAADDLVNRDGFPRRVDDKTMTMPMIELAGVRSAFIDEVLYLYRYYQKDIGFSAAQDRQKWYSRLIRDIIRHKPRQRPLDEAEIDAEIGGEIP